MGMEKILSEMTVYEKAVLVSETDFIYTNANPRLGLPPLTGPVTVNC